MSGSYWCVGFDMSPIQNPHDIPIESLLYQKNILVSRSNPHFIHIYIHIQCITYIPIYGQCWIVYMYISSLHPSMTYITPSYKRYIPHYIPLQWASHEALECIAVCTGAQPRALPGHQGRADQGNQGTIWEFEWEEHGKIWKNMGTIYPPLYPHQIPQYIPHYMEEHGKFWGKLFGKVWKIRKNHRKIWESKRNV